MRELSMRSTNHWSPYQNYIRVRPNQSLPAPEAMSLDQPVLSLPIFASVVGGTAVVVFSIVVYCTWRCWKTKSEHESEGSSPTSRSPNTSYSNLNLKISQSEPDLMAGEQAKLASPSFLQRLGKGTYKHVLRQTTLPTVSQRHLSFQRQLSYRLDMSNVEFSIQSVRHKEQPGLGQIRPELYRQNAQEPTSSSTAILNTCGWLYYSINYNPVQEELRVFVEKAEALPAKDFSGTSDPYVKVYLLPDRRNKYQTRVLRKTLNPEFNEVFYFAVSYKDIADRTLQFSLYDFDRFSRHDLIGVVMMNNLGSVDLTKEKYFKKEILCVQQEKVDLGELMLSLCYLPTAGRMTVTLIKARNLKAMDITGSSDPYVKVSLMCQGKRIKKKKTSVKRNTLNPVYNEAMVFDVPQENVEEVYLLVKVIDYDRVGSNELMGCCALGMQYVGVGRDHWYEMLENPRKPVAQWYSLLETVPGLDGNNSRQARSCIK